MPLPADANPCSQLLTARLVIICDVVVLVVEGELRDYHSVRTARLITDTQLPRIDAVRATVALVVIQDCPHKRATLLCQNLSPTISVGTLPEQGCMLLNRHLYKGTLGLGRQR